MEKIATLIKINNSNEKRFVFFGESGDMDSCVFRSGNFFCIDALLLKDEAIPEMVGLEPDQNLYVIPAPRPKL